MPESKNQVLAAPFTKNEAIRWKYIVALLMKVRSKYHKLTKCCIFKIQQT